MATSAQEDIGSRGYFPAASVDHTKARNDILGCFGRSDRSAQRGSPMRRSITPRRARAGLQTSLIPSEETAAFRHLSEYGSVRASGEPLLAAYAPIAAWPKGGEPWPAWWNRPQPRAVLAADGGPLPGCARRGCATRGLERVATALTASVRQSACSASARNHRSSVADGP